MKFIKVGRYWINLEKVNYLSESKYVCFGDQCSLGLREEEYEELKMILNRKRVELPPISDDDLPF